MGKKERLYERPLKRALDAETRQAIEAEFHRRRHEFPIPMELGWTRGHQSLTIVSKWVSFLVHFANDRMVVDAEMTLAARVFATDSNRQKIITLIDDVVDQLEL